MSASIRRYLGRHTAKTIYELKKEKMFIAVNFISDFLLESVSI